jgi:dihydrofolate reductase
MSAVTFEISMSLDGYVTGPDPGPDQPLGRGGESIHDWIYGLRSWRESHGMSGGVDSADSELLARSIERVGASIMGRGMFGGGGGEWGDDPWNGWWGEDPPFDHPVFVLTHHEREPLVLGSTTFVFVSAGIEAALEQAKAAAGDKNVAVAGGANAFQQFLAAGLIDELTIHVVPLLLGGGTRLFGDLEPAEVGLEQVGAVASDAVTHLTYRVVR